MLIEQYLEYFEKEAAIAKLLYWKACFLCLQGEADQGLQTLQDGLGRGLWWSQRRLKFDEDLSPLQDNETYQELIIECIVRHKKAQRTNNNASYLFEMPSPSIKPPIPIMLALHGHASNAAFTLPHWSNLKTSGWLVTAIQSSQLAGMDEFHWTDVQRARDDVNQCLTSISADHHGDTNQTAISGYSNGARVALELALKRSVRCNWVISIGGYLLEEQLRQINWQQLKKAISPKVLLVVGEYDRFALEKMRDQAAIMQSKGVNVMLQIVPGIAHTIPNDLADRIQRWMSEVNR